MSTAAPLAGQDDVNPNGHDSYNKEAGTDDINYHTPTQTAGGHVDLDARRRAALSGELSDIQHGNLILIVFAFVRDRQCQIWMVSRMPIVFAQLDKTLLTLASISQIRAVGYQHVHALRHWLTLTPAGLGRRRWFLHRCRTSSDFIRNYPIHAHLCTCSMTSLPSSTLAPLGSSTQSDLFKLQHRLHHDWLRALRLQHHPQEQAHRQPRFGHQGFHPRWNFGRSIALWLAGRCLWP